MATNDCIAKRFHIVTKNRPVGVIMNCPICDYRVGIEYVRAVTKEDPHIYHQCTACKSLMPLDVDSTSLREAIPIEGKLKTVRICEMCAGRWCKMNEDIKDPGFD